MKSGKHAFFINLFVTCTMNDEFHRFVLSSIHVTSQLHVVFLTNFELHVVSGSFN